MTNRIPVFIFLISVLSVIGTLSAQEDIQSHLGRAVYDGNLELVRELIRAGADVNQGSSNDRTTPLSNAVSLERADIIQLLAEAGANVNEENSRGRSLLIRAVIGNKQAIVTSLLNVGADPNWIDRTNRDALDYVFSNKQIDLGMAYTLIDAGADINRVRPAGTLLQQACTMKKPELVRKLLESGADPNIADPLGMTPLFAAVASGDRELVRLLIAGGADLNARALNMTPAEMARASNDQEMANLLLSLESSGSVGSPATKGASQHSSLKDSGRQALANYQSAASGQRNRPDKPSTPKPAPPGLFAFQIPGNPDPSSGGVYIHSRPDIEEGKRCHERGEIGAAGVEEVTGYRLFTERERVVGVSGETVYVPKGRYRLVETMVATPWKWVCSGVLHTTTGKVNSLWSLRREEGKTTENEQWVNLGTEPPGEKPEKEKPSIEILTPDADAEFTFNGSEKGMFLILASAEVTPAEMEEQVEWTLEGIGDAEIEISPEKGATVEIRVKGLPENNEDFGEKTLTARIPGDSDETTLKIFFWPTAMNHPGEGNGETPNWFHYWSQTSAAGGHSSNLRYKANLPAMNRPGDSVLARHERTDDFIYFSDLTHSSKVCTRRAEAITPAGIPAPSGENASGIDCFGELVLHEARHRFEWHKWWLDGTNQLTRFVHQLTEDGDADYVPQWLEENEPGCSDNNQYSCSNRPQFKSEPANVPDTELYAYYEGWKWVVASADEEDWSHCGKQWTLTQCER